MDFTVTNAGILAYSGAAYDPVNHQVLIFGGATSRLLSFGIEIDPDMRVDANDDDAVSKARSLLARHDRPTAILALWTRMSHAVGAACRELGLEFGGDVETVVFEDGK